MRITCGTLDDFIEVLDSAQSVFTNTIHLNVNRRPTSNDREPTSFHVTFQSSAVVRVDEESEFLLSFGAECGKDYVDADGLLDGTQKAEEWKQRLIDYAKRRGWRVLPGVLEI